MKKIKEKAIITIGKVVRHAILKDMHENPQKSFPIYYQAKRPINKK